MKTDNPMLHAKHIFRLVLLLVVAIVALVLGRSAFVPDTWGEHGSYRASNVPEQRALPVVHGGDVSCQPCHEEEYETKADGAHAPVRCEGCHAPVTAHARDGEKFADMPKPTDNTVCLRCHEQLDARPTSHPQVDPRQHVKRMGEDWSDDICLDCHIAHEPAQ